MHRFIGLVVAVGLVGAAAIPAAAQEGSAGKRKPEPAAKSAQPQTKQAGPARGSAAQQPAKRAAAKSGGGAGKPARKAAGEKPAPAPPAPARSNLARDPIRVSDEISMLPNGQDTTGCRRYSMSSRGFGPLQATFYRTAKGDFTTDRNEAVCNR